MLHIKRLLLNVHILDYNYKTSSPETVPGQGDLVIKLDVSLFETHLITSRFHCNLLHEWRDVGNVMVFAQLQHCS